jgi:hypothetical protein
MRYSIIIEVLPVILTEADLQRLINNAVPADKNLVSTSIYSDAGQLRLLIVFH